MDFVKSMTLINFGLQALHLYLMVPANFHDVDGDLSDHNVGKIFQLSNILTVVL